MSLVSSRLSLTHRCTIRRDANAATSDSWTQPTAPNWQTHLGDQVCRGWTTSERLVIKNTETFVSEDRRLTLPLDTDVTQADQIGDVTDRGAIVLDGPMRIDGLVRYSDRLELALTRIS